jgi:putative transposase
MFDVKRMEPRAECMLVLIGATAEGKKELIGFQTGMRESGQSWKELLVDLKARGLVVAPQVAIGDGALGFWKVLDEAFPKTRHQRCWLHKTLNMLDELPKSMQPNAAQGSARDLDVAEPGRGGSGDDDLRRKIRAQIRQGRRMPDQGSAETADIRRPSSRSLGPLANLEPDRERIRDGEASRRPHERRAVAGHRASHINGIKFKDGIETFVEIKSAA